MCLAIYKPKGIRIARRYLKHGFDNNGDGAGFAVCENNEILISKGFYTFDEFLKSYEPHADKAAVIHFRLATHGDKTSRNCHPFSLFDGQYAMIHNGILNIATSHQKDMSDTWHFAELVLKPMLSRMTFDHPALKYLIETSIGSFNKIVMLRRDGAHMIYNEKQGEWNRGAWYSNGSYKHGRIYTTALEWASEGTDRVRDAWDNVKERFPDYEPSHGHTDLTDAEVEAAIAEANDEAEWAHAIAAERGDDRLTADDEYKQAEALLMREHRGDTLTDAELELLDKVFPCPADEAEPVVPKVVGDAETAFAEWEMMQ
jgi:predicted glutamine amidotransferase